MRIEDKRPSIIQIWERYSVPITKTMHALDSLRLIVRDAPKTPVPLANLALDLIGDSRKADSLIRDDPEAAKGLALYLLFKAFLNHLSACRNLLRQALVQESGILLRSMLELIDLMEFVVSDRCKADHLTKWWRGKILPHRLSRERATHFVYRGTLHMQLTESITPGAITIPESIRMLQYSLGSRYVHHTSHVIAGATLGGRGGTDPLAELFEEYDNFIVWLPSAFVR